MEKKYKIILFVAIILIVLLFLLWVRSQFGVVFDIGFPVGPEELIDKIKESGELLVFDRTEIGTIKGKKETFYIGIKNNQAPAEEAQPVCFAMAIKCLQALNPEASGYCSSQPNDIVPNNGTVGGNEATGGKRATANWFSLFKTVDIKEGDVGVYPITIQITKAKPDSYLMSLDVYKDENNTKCGQNNKWGKMPYQSKQFFVILSSP